MAGRERRPDTEIWFPQLPGSRAASSMDPVRTSSARYTFAGLRSSPPLRNWALRNGNATDVRPVGSALTTAAVTKSDGRPLIKVTRNFGSVTGSVTAPSYASGVFAG